MLQISCFLRFYKYIIYNKLKILKFYLVLFLQFGDFLNKLMNQLISSRV